MKKKGKIDQDALRKAVAELPAEQRESVVLHYFMGISLAQMSKVLSVAEDTIALRLSLARKALAVLLG